MAFQISDGSGTPHATDYSDLLAKFATFVLAQASYSAHLNDGTTLIVESTGTGGTDNIIWGIQKYSNVGAGNFGWWLNGYTGYDSGLAFHTQPGAIDPTVLPALPLWNSTIPYWFFVNERRAIVVAKVNGRYMTMHMGLMLPCGSPAVYAYPIMISGTARSNYLASVLPVTPDNIGNGNSVGWICLNNGSGSNNGLAAVRLPDGTWYRPNQPSAASWSGAVEGFWPWTEQFSVATGGYSGIRPSTDSGVDDYPLYRPILCTADSNIGNTALGTIWAFLDGIWFVPGFSNAAENTINSSAYIVFQNVFRTDSMSYFAITKA